MTLALALLAFQTSAPMLPPPAGWRGERLEFPLSFAPEIELRGFEELAFAPGMFAPDSDSYFSYALALRLEGEVDVDAAFLDSFLERYYRGLCGAVGKERGLTLDLDAVKAEVLRDGERFTATVDLFDAFGTGAPLELALELESHALPRATEVLGLASPLDRDAPIWKELRALGDRWRATRPASVTLNHVYFVVDRATYDALLGSAFLRELAVTEERETVRADGSYTGLYLYGRRTYFEFLPSGAAGLDAGSTGLALGLERPGATKDFARRLDERGVRSRAAQKTRALDGKQVPWFELMGIEMAQGPLTVFTLEYDPRFLAGWHPDLVPAHGGIARADVLERYAAALGGTKTRDGGPLVDVAEVQLALDAAQRERLLALCVVAGHEVEPQGAEWLVHAPGVRLRIRNSSLPGGITAIELALRAPIARQPLRLGKLELVFQERTATLRVLP